MRSSVVSMYAWWEKSVVVLGGEKGAGVCLALLLERFFALSSFNCDPQAGSPCIANGNSSGCGTPVMRLIL